MNSMTAVKQRHRQKKTPTSYGATSANQVWSWDVSYLPTPVRGQFYYLYAILDIHSCKTTGWDVHGCEHGDYAADLVHDAVLSEECPSDSLVLHADNGSIQKGSTLRAKLEFLGVSSSFIRARVSNDNPYTESLFRTCKYRPNYPTNGFESIEAAHEWMMKFVHWYNNVHRHGGIKHVTPAQRHSGEDIVILKKRRAVYEAAKLKNPDRWSAATRNWDHVKQMGLNPEKQSIETVPPEKAVA
jgi:putative transposase